MLDYYYFNNIVFFSPQLFGYYYLKANSCVNNLMTKELLIHYKYFLELHLSFPYRKRQFFLILLNYFGSIISLKIIVLLINCDIEIPHWCSFISNMLTIFHYCCCSVAKSCPIHCDPMDYSTQGSPAPYYLPEFAQIHAHSVSDAI